MRSLLALLVIIGVFAGAIGRAASHAFPHHHATCQTAGCESVDSDCCGRPVDEPACCGSAHAHAHADEEEHPDTKVPDHHHHHICCVMSPLMAGDETPIVFIGFDGVRAPLSVEHHAAPEGPVFELDLPPLI